MLGLALASAFAPAMFREAVDWPRIHAWLTNGAPQPLDLASETREVVEQQIARIRAAYDVLRQQLEAFRPDVIVMLASDSGRVFTRVQVPQIATYLGEEIWGSTRYAEIAEPAEDDVVRLPCAPQLAAFLHRELVHLGFDVSYSRTLRPLGQPEYGTTAAFVAPARVLMPSLDIPVVPIYINTLVWPAPNGHRCYALGQSISELLSEREERVALLACGGLSHDHHGPRAGWIDQPFDRWVLEQVARGKGTEMKSMYDLESDALRGGGGQVRLWIIAAAAAETLGAKARIVDYFPSGSAATGMGFAYWPIAVAGAPR
ncbi:MAG: hypothetical protein GEU73_05760 [Chloroflexi bacterium]|nr:hypothetical protein [Chloroflexota bacterium]